MAVQWNGGVGQAFEKQDVHPFDLWQKYKLHDHRVCEVRIVERNSPQLFVFSEFEKRKWGPLIESDCDGEVPKRGELVDEVLEVDSVVCGNIAVFSPGQSQAMNSGCEFVVLIESLSQLTNWIVWWEVETYTSV